jgi:hypothetical protein
MKYFFTFSLLFIAAVCTSQISTGVAGEIKGRVSDLNGNSVSSAKLFAVAVEVGFEGIRPPSTTTNRNGEFEFRRGFEWGEHKLYARKQADAYADRSHNF